MNIIELYNVYEIIYIHILLFVICFIYIYISHLMDPLFFVIEIITHGIIVLQSLIIHLSFDVSIIQTKQRERKRKKKPRQNIFLMPHSGKTGTPIHPTTLGLLFSLLERKNRTKEN